MIVKDFTKSLQTLMLLIFLGLTAHSQTFVHPGILHTQADFDRMQIKVNAGAQPWKSGWDKLIANSHAQTSYNPNPIPIVYRGGSTQNFTGFMNDAAAAYQCALRWKISGETVYADKAVQILNSWAQTCKGVSGSTDAALAVGLQGFAFANAAEIVRDYNGWSRTDFENYKKWMLDVFYAPATNFLYNRNGTCASHYWANWGLCNASAVIAIGILCDNKYIYNEGMAYIKTGKYTEAINQLVWYLHSPVLGQWQESNRDQGHSLLGIGLAADICEVAWNQGDDLYGYNNNRLLAGFEYVTKYNLGLDVPNVPYNNCDNVNQTTIGDFGRGGNRPFAEKIYNHYVNRKGVAVPYSQQYAEANRPEGGGGDYGGNSGGYDLLGFGTLTNTLDPIVNGCAVSSISPISKINNGSPIASANITIAPGSAVTLSPQTADTGTWSWNTGQTSAELTLSNVQTSGVYRVTFTNACGKVTIQSYVIAVLGDCIEIQIVPYMRVNNGAWQNVKEVTVDKGSKIDLGPQPNSGGTWSWSNGLNVQNFTITNIQRDSTIIASYTTPCGRTSTSTFKIILRNPGLELAAKLAEAIKLRDTTQTSGVPVVGKFPISENSQLNDSITYVQHVYNPVSSTLPQINGYIKLLDNAIVRYKQSIYFATNTLVSGVYFIKIPLIDSVWTPTSSTNTPKFDDFQQERKKQLFNITKESNGRYKITAVANPPAGFLNYINENAQFGKNAYDATWNTMNIYYNGKTYAIQRAQKAGNGYWYPSNALILAQSGSANSAIPLSFPFELKPDLLTPIDFKLAEAIKLRDSTLTGNPTELGKYPAAKKQKLMDSIAYVQSVYDTISTPYSSAAMVNKLSNVLTEYKQSVYYQTNQLTDGIYFLKVRGQELFWTKNATNSPSFESISQTPDLQRWKVVKESNNRYKVTCMSAPTNFKNYINESATFGNNDYLATWNTMNVYFNGSSYAFQRAQLAGNGYWYQNANKIAATGNLTDAFPYTFPFMLVPAPDSQTITFDQISPKMIGDSSFTVSATSSSGLPVSYTLSDTTIAKMELGKIVMKKAGTTTLIASQAGSGFYAAAADVAQTITVKDTGLKLTYKNGDNAFGNNIIKADLQISNLGTIAIPLKELSVRYWFTAENYSQVKGYIDYAQVGTQNVGIRYVPLDKPRSGAFGYMEYTFSSGAAIPVSGSTGMIQSRFSNQDYGVFSEEDDYSHQAFSNTFNDNDHITLYRNGVLVSGIEPSLVPEVSSVKVLSQNQNPNTTNNSISTFLSILNTGNTPLELTALSARYWFSSEGEQALNLYLDYAKMGSSNISGRFIPVIPARVKADQYLELSINNAVGLLYPLSSTGNIQYRIAKSNWSAFNESNDHSFMPKAAMQENPSVTVYYKGNLIYGTEPAANFGTTMFANQEGKNSSTSKIIENGNTQPVNVIYPNPVVNGQFSIRLLPELSNTRIEVTIRNSFGQVMQRSTIQSNEDQLHVPLQGNYLAGVYFVQLNNLARLSMIVQ